MHLLSGTHQDNMDDQGKRGRRNIGEKNGNSILTQKQADTIKVDGRVDRVVANDYGVSRSLV